MNQHDFRCQYSPEKKLAVTGATGYIGAHLCSYAHTTFMPLDIHAVPEETTWIHCAADLNLHADALVGNLERDLVLIELINQKHQGLIYLSSNNVYPNALQCRINETLESKNHYDSAKIIGEFLIASMLKKPYCLVRVADVFGVGQKHGVFFKALEQAITQHSPINVFGQGGKIRSYIYAPELAYYLLFLAQQMQTHQPIPSILNCCYPETPTLKQIAEYISQQTALPIKSVAMYPDLSHLDIRSMLPSALERYTYSWPSFFAAIDDYIKLCVLQKDTSVCAS